MSIENLQMKQNYPLWMKVKMTKRRIQEWVDEYGIDGVYISFSGGKDSTVLLNIAREMYPEIKAMFVDTGLEYPELKEHVKTFENVDIIRPKKSFKQVVEDYGYPVISKEQSRYIHDIKYSKSEKLKSIRLNGSEKGNFKLSKKWYFMLDADFKISDNCCNIMKKNPAKNYENKTNRKPIIATMACESNLRKQKYLKYGCNAFNLKRPNSTPMSFWTEQDVLKYIIEKDLEIPSVYGNVVEKYGLYDTTGVKRTGCIFCCYGVHLEDKNDNRFTKLEKSHPQIHKYCIEEMGLGKVLDFMNINYKKEV